MIDQEKILDEAVNNAWQKFVSDKFQLIEQYRQSMESTDKTFIFIKVFIDHNGLIDIKLLDIGEHEPKIMSNLKTFREVGFRVPLKKNFTLYKYIKYNLADKMEISGNNAFRINYVRNKI